MATDIEHGPASERQPLSLNSGAEKLSGILSRGQPEEAPETPEAVEPPAAETEVQEPERDVPVQEAEESEAKAEEPEAKQAKDKSAKDDEPESEVTSEIELEPAQVAQILGLDEGDIDVDDDGVLSIHAKIDGKPAKVPLRDLRHSYELAQTHEERLRQLGRERKAFQEESQAVLAELSNQHQHFANSVQALEEEYAQDFNSENWAELREQDPTEYNAKRLDYEDRRRRINEYRARAQAQGQQLQQEQQKKLQQLQLEGAKALDDVFQGEAYRSVPKWSPDESKRLAEWIIDQGFSPQDVSSVGVWQIFKWARDSMLREQELKSAKETVKKVAKLPKITKPGTPKSKPQANKAKIQELKARQRKSGGTLRESTELIRGILER